MQDQKTRLREGTSGRTRFTPPRLRGPSGSGLEARRSRPRSEGRRKHRHKRPDREELWVSEVLPSQNNCITDEPEAHGLKPEMLGRSHIR